MHDRDLLGEAGQEGGLFHGGVAAAHDHDFLVRVKGPVAGRAGRHALAGLHHGRLLLETQQLGPGAGRDDDRVGLVAAPHLVVQDEGSLVRLDRLDVLERDALGAEAFRLGLKALHQLGAHDALREARIVLDVGRDGELAAGLHTLEDDGLEAGARGVERGGVAGRTGSDDDEVVDHGSGILGPRRGRCRCDWKVVD